MNNFGLNALLRAKSGDAPVVASLMTALDGPLTIEDASGKVLMGTAANGTSRVPVICTSRKIGVT
jgi:hypothetical protein